jgi:hypothetical protein
MGRRERVAPNKFWLEGIPMTMSRPIIRRIRLDRMELTVEVLTSLPFTRWYRRSCAHYSDYRPSDWITLKLQTNWFKKWTIDKWKELPSLISLLFWLMKMLQNSSTAMWNSTFFQGLYPRTPIAGGGDPLPHPPPARPLAMRGRCSSDHPYATYCVPQYSKQFDASASKCLGRSEEAANNETVIRHVTIRVMDSRCQMGRI